MRQVSELSESSTGEGHLRVQKIPSFVQPIPSFVQPRSPRSVLLAPGSAVAGDDVFRLRVVVVMATGLSRDAIDQDSPEMYCFFEIPGKEGTEYHTASVKAAADPVWQCKAEISGYQESDELNFYVKNVDEVLLGKCTLSAESLLPMGFMGDIPLTDEAGAALGAKLSLIVALPGHDSPGRIITIDKAEGKVGMALAPGREEKALIVRKVHEEGLVKHWNNDHPERPVKPGDRIEAVNFARGDVQAMLMEIATCKGKLVLLVKHSFCPLDPPTSLSKPALQTSVIGRSKNAVTTTQPASQTRVLDNSISGATGPRWVSPQTTNHAHQITM